MSTNTNMIQFNNCEEEEYENYFFVDNKKIEITTVPISDIMDWAEECGLQNNFYLRENSLHRILKYYDIHKIDVTVTDPIFIRVFSNHPIAKNCFRISFEDYSKFQKKHCRNTRPTKNWNKEGF